jgi:alpha-beta hydrolase superfamily lysophospholipase
MSSPTMTEETVSIDTGNAMLEGTLSLPKETTPIQVVLLLAGSNEQDRNQNSANAQFNIFNDIADHLALHGIASLRYDKRGCGNSGGNFDKAGHTDLVDDALVCAHFLQNRADLSNTPLFLLGHGEGTLIAPQVIAQSNGIEGQILLSPFLENYASIIRRQAEKSLTEIAVLPGFKGKLIRFVLRLSGDQIAKQKKLIERIQRTSKSTIKIRKQVINAKWIREMVNLDACIIHASVKTNTLVIGGSKDLQSLPGDADELSGILKGPVETHVIDDLTHILRRDPKEPSTQHYSELTEESVDAELLEITVQWLSSQIKYSQST